MASRKALTKPSAAMGEQRTAVMTQSWSGPLPPPEVFERYNAVSPELAKQIGEMALNQQRHRHDMEKEGSALDAEMVRANVTTERRGQWFAAYAVSLCAVVAVAALVAGSPLAAAAIMGTTVVSLTGAFIVGKRSALPATADQNQLPAELPTPSGTQPPRA